MNACAADLAELVHQREAAENHMIVHVDVSGQRSGIGEGDVVADDAVVGDVDVGHDPVVVTDPGQAATIAGAAAEGAELADHVAVADDQLGVLAVKLLVLRLAAQRGKLPDAVFAADAGGALDHHMRADPGVVADLHIGADDGAGADADAAPQLGLRIDVGAGVDHPSLRSAQRISALAASSPSTSARHSNSPMRLSMRFWCISMTSWSPGATVREKRALSTLTR